MLTQRRVLIALLGLSVLGFFIATLANRVPSSFVFADDTPEPSALWGWGFNNYGMLGDGTNVDKNTPTQEGTGATNWSAISADLYHTVALKSDGTLWTWGHNIYGQLGDGTNVDKNTPTQESTGATNWSAIAARGVYTVALKSDGTLWTWERIWSHLVVVKRSEVLSQPASCAAAESMSPRRHSRIWTPGSISKSGTLPTTLSPKVVSRESLERA